MGAEIHIRLVSDKHDDRELAPFLGRDFHYEIAQGKIWENHEKFLTPTETEILNAPYYEEFEDDSVKHLNPRDLMDVMLKVKSYLKENEKTLPFEVILDYNRMEKEIISTDLKVNGIRCWIKGDSLYYNVQEKVEIVNLPQEPHNINLWINLSDQFEIDGHRYYVKKVTRYEKFGKLIDIIIEFCKLAEKENEKIFWLYSH